MSNGNLLLSTDGFATLLEDVRLLTYEMPDLKEAWQMKHMERWKVLSYCHDTGGLFTDGQNTYVLDDIDRWCILDDAINAIDKQNEQSYKQPV